MARSWLLLVFQEEVISNLSNLSNWMNVEVLKHLCAYVICSSIVYTGKSTLALLLERFYELQSGQITIDGVDIAQCSPKWLRGRCIGFISQVRSET